MACRALSYSFSTIDFTCSPAGIRLINTSGMPWPRTLFKANMTESDGFIMTMAGLPKLTEAPWVHQHNGWYYPATPPNSPISRARARC